MPPIDPLSSLTNEQVLQVLQALGLACGRSHGAYRRNRQQWFCFLFQNLVVSADLRGLPRPGPPWHDSDLKPFSL